MTTVRTQQEQREIRFLQNWLADLVNAMQACVDRPTQTRLMEACGKACFRRFDFKQELALTGKGSLAKLVQAYRQYFETWHEGDRVHIRYGEKSSQCYCPVGRCLPQYPGDVHCECSRATHQAVFEMALGRGCPVEVVESVRRGGTTCHLVVHVGKDQPVK